jgi:hypothetical protein
MSYPTEGVTSCSKKQETKAVNTVAKPGFVGASQVRLCIQSIGIGAGFFIERKKKRGKDNDG